ncbi:MAG: saccharopine dehydrogenase NADP-binding domain-containing protein [Thermodesulfobacteriota bacterium]
MKVICLGGTGGMGRYAARTAAAFDFVDEIVIADLNGTAAEAFASQLGKKSRGLAVDVRNPELLDSVLAQGDIVLNTVGPFFRFGVPILKAAMRTGRNYIDLCDDWEPTLEMLDLHEAADRAGITAVIGLGASPGITNLLAVLAIRELDRADRIYTVWDLDSAKPETIGPTPSAAMIHGMLQLTGTIRVWENGGYREVRPVRKVMVNYPGIGLRPSWSIGHPEAITLPRYFPKLKTSRNLMVTSRLNIIALRVVGAMVNTGLLSIEAAARIAEKVEGTGVGRTPDDFIRETKEGGKLRLPPIFALAEGEKNGRPASVAVTVSGAPAGGMGGATGVPLAAGLSLFQKEVKPGVYAPEGIVEPRAFLDFMAPLCDPPRKNASEMLIVTRSWEVI